MNLTTYIQAMQLIHHGSDKFNANKFEPITDRHWVKPDGGLWTSPAGSNWGWKQWCEAESYGVSKLETSFTVSFTGHMLVIDCLKDLGKLPWIDSLNVPLFQPLKLLDVDAVHLTVKGQNETRHSRPRNLYGWDCETVLVLNAASIRER